MNDMLTTPTPRDDSRVDFGQPQRFITIGDDEIAYWRAGSGPDLVLVHGWPLHAATWREIVPVLAKHFTCHVIDLPGAGHTRSRRPTPLCLADHERTLLATIEALGIERCAFVAHDSGAAITRLAAAELGDRVWATVMGNTEIPGHRPWLVMLFGILTKLGGAGAFSGMLRSRTIRRSYIAFGSCFLDKAVIDGDFHELFVAPMLTSRRLTTGQLRLLAGFDWADVDGLADIHRRMTGPVKMIWGRHDPYFPLAKARHMRFPGGTEMHVIDDAKLFAHEEAPDEFAAHTLSFLREHAPR